MSLSFRIVSSIIVVNPFSLLHRFVIGVSSNIFCVFDSTGFIGNVKNTIFVVFEYGIYVTDPKQFILTGNGASRLKAVVTINIPESDNSSCRPESLFRMRL